MTFKDIILADNSNEMVLFSLWLVLWSLILKVLITTAAADILIYTTAAADILIYFLFLYFSE